MAIDDVVWLFLEWLKRYSELHLKVVATKVGRGDHLNMRFGAWSIREARQPLHELSKRAMLDGAPDALLQVVAVPKAAVRPEDE